VDKIGVYQDVSTKVVTLYCEYDDAPVKAVDNDVVAVTGFAVSAGLGAVIGLVIYFVKLIRSRRNG